MATKPIMLGSPAATKLVQAYMAKHSAGGPLVRPSGSSAKPPAKAATPPAKPGLVAPFLNPDDLQALNDFITNFGQQTSTIDTNLANQSIDTNYQKAQNDQNAVQQTAATADSMAARGLFQSSIKDASMYDIEAQRALSDKFLDDKLTAATLDAGTQKKLLADSKVRFDTAMAAKQAQNASAVNDPLSAAWAAAMAKYTAAHPTSPKPKAVTPPKPRPAAVPKPRTRPAYGQGTARNVGGNRSQGTGRVLAARPPRLVGTARQGTPGVGTMPNFAGKY